MMWVHILTGGLYLVSHFFHCRTAMEVFTSHRKESKAKGEAPHPLSDVHEKPHLAKGKANHKHWKKAIKSAVVSNTFKSAVPDKLLRDQVEKYMATSKHRSS
jgi:hypothetical protein